MRFGVMFFVLGMLIFMVFSFMWAAEEEAQKQLRTPPLPTANPLR